MLRIIRQFFSPRHSVTPKDQKLETTLVYVRVKPDPKPGPEAQVESPDVVTDSAQVAVSHPVVSRALAVQRPNPTVEGSSKGVSRRSLASLEIFTARQIRLLSGIGVQTDRDLHRMTAQRLEKRLATYANSQRDLPTAPPVPPIDRIRSLVKRGRWAIRFSGYFNAMTPHEALFLRAVHRGNREALAQDSAGMIRRDLQRLALSSRGKRLVALDEIPELPRVKSWIAEARDRQKSAAQFDDTRSVPIGLEPSEESQPNVPMMPR